MKITLAPMQGLTELLFRKVYNTCFPGAIDEAISPFISLTHGNISASTEKIDDVLPSANEGSIPVVPQILGNDTAEFIALGNRLYELGYKEVNWNIGCPMRRIAHKHRGSGILPYPDEVEHVLACVVPNLKGKLSIKMRLGYRSNDELFRLIPIINSYPLGRVIIHPRNGMQLYGGKVDTATFQRAASAIAHPTIYNGDIFTIDDYLSVAHILPREEIMLGRGVLYNPTLPLQIKHPEATLNATEQHQAARKLSESLMKAISELDLRSEAKMRKSKEYWCLTSRAFNITEEQRRYVLRCSTFDETFDAIERVTR